MKKLLIAGCALAAMGLAGSAQAAPVASPQCSIMGQVNNVSWSDTYHCWGVAPKAAPTAAKPVAAKRDPMCSLSGGNSLVSWNERYGCWK
jgi:hypothetical protein